MYVPGGKFYPFFDEPGTFVTSVDLLVIRDDGFYLDFADSTFKDSGWTTKVQALTEKTEGVWVWATGWTIPAGNRQYRTMYKDNTGTVYRGEVILALLPTNFSALALTATGAVGINWGNVENLGASNYFSSTRIFKVDDVVLTEIVDTVNEVQTVLSVDTVLTLAVGSISSDAFLADTPEPGQVEPPAVATLPEKVSFMYKGWR